MIRGYFPAGHSQAPYIRCKVEFRDHDVPRDTVVAFIVDTGADRTVLSQWDARRLGLNVSDLEEGDVARGVGGEVPLRVVEATLTADNYPVRLTLNVAAGDHTIPSLLGRDFMAGFALFFEEDTRTVVLLDKDEVASLGLAF